MIYRHLDYSLGRDRVLLRAAIKEGIPGLIAQARDNLTKNEKKAIDWLRGVTCWEPGDFRWLREV